MSSIDYLYFKKTERDIFVTFIHVHKYLMAQNLIEFYNSVT